MNQRKLVGAIAFCLLLLLALGLRFAGVSHDEWSFAAKLAFLIAIGTAFFVAFYDRRNFPEKTWDFNPKRGVLYFVAGWLVFPLTMAINALFGADLSLNAVLVATLLLSTFAGILGVFTENVGV